MLMKPYHSPQCVVSHNCSLCKTTGHKNCISKNVSVRPVTVLKSELCTMKDCALPHA